ncbi:hypothetical protein HDU99_009383 [Rhizoclosmatium hyalinum]|nr:hypothetical protein HDU99_009383 [Rhizoclosmatium hyalinum]
MANETQDTQQQQQQRSKDSKDPLDVAKPEDILLMAKWYFILGCAFLPFMWLVNFVHLYKVSQRRKHELSPSVSTCECALLQSGGALCDQFHIWSLGSLTKSLSKSTLDHSIQFKTVSMIG